MPTLQSKIRGCLLGVAIGDALGVPVEMYTREKILEITNGKGITGYLDANKYRNKQFDPKQEYAFGQTSDDWQLTAATAKSLIRCQKLDLIDQSLSYINSLETSTMGWGYATKTSLEEIKKYYDTRGTEGRNPLVPAQHPTTKGGGNGAAMKVAPLALWRLRLDQGSRDEEQHLDNCTLLHKMTHDKDYAVAAADTLLETIYLYLVGKDIYGETAESYLQGLINLNYLRTPHQAKFFSALGRGLLINDDLLLSQNVGASCLAFESVPFALCMARKYKNNFREGALATINMGGDTDTNCSMVLAQIGAIVGEEGIPKEWILDSMQECINIADQIYENVRK